MTTFLIILGLLVVAAGVYFYAIKTGKIEDADGDLIADDVEDVAKEVKRRAKNVKAELADVKKAAKELGDQLEDVVEAAAGKPRRVENLQAKALAKARVKQQRVLALVQVLKESHLKNKLI